MPVQFPNFLQVAVRTPDYSGLSDIISNYYAGKAMPKEDLIKSIQAQFARPTAEQNLLSTKLSNRKSQIEIDKALREMAEQKQFEAQLRQALTGGGNIATGNQNPYPQNMPVNPPMIGENTPPKMTVINPSLGKVLADASGASPQITPSGSENEPVFDDGLDRTKMAARYRKIDQAATGLPDSAYKPGANTAGNFETILTPEEEAKFQKWKTKYAPNDSGEDYDLRGAFKAGVTPDEKTGHWPDTFKKPNHPTFSNQSIYANAAPQLAGSWNGENYIKPTAQPEEPHEVVIAQGFPHLSGIDQMYENNPLSRAFLEKKGYKKTEEVKFDSKTGKTSLITKYPSGKITLKTISPNEAATDTENGIPLTKPVLNKVVNQIRGADAVMPYIDKILKMGDLQFDKKGNPIGAGKNNQLPMTHYLPTDANAGYKRTVSEALEKYMNATGLSSTDLSTKKVEEILERALGESTDHYLIELYNKKKEMMEDRKRNVEMVTKGLKKYGNLDTENEAPKYSSDEWEPV